MSLYTPQQATSYWQYNNWATVPSATPGVSVLSGTANAEGSWTQIVTPANVAFDVHSFHMRVHTGAVSGNVRPSLLDIGVDPAGGSSYVEIIYNLNIGETPASGGVGSREYFFPMKINAGSSIAARIAGRFATSSRISMTIFGGSGADGVFPVGTYSETYGANSINGIVVTPGNATYGSWVLIGTTTNPIWWWQLGHGIYNSTITTQYTDFELAVGDGSNKSTIFKTTHAGTTSETCGLLHHTQLCWPAAYRPVPAGTGVYVRAICQNAPDTGYGVTVVGIGG